MSKGTVGGPPVAVWFRQDLRLQDHAALQAAPAGGRAVLPAYVLDEIPGAWTPESARLPDRFVRPPWSAPPAMPAEAGVELGRSHPNPIADLPQAWQRTLAMYRASVRRAA